MVTLTIADTESVEMSVSEEPAPSFNAGLTTVVTENNYNDLRNKPSIEGTELNGDVSLNALNGYTQEQIDTKLSVKADRSEIPSLNGYATEQWVENKHYLTEHQSLSDYYTKTQTDNLLDDKADASDVPTKTSQLTNDSGYITDAGVTSWNNQTGAVTFAESDPTVPSWAKSPNKPTYTASEVGAVPTTRKVNNKALSADIALTASDVGALPNTTAIPSKTSDLTNDSGYITLADLPVYNGGVS